MQALQGVGLCPCCLWYNPNELLLSLCCTCLFLSRTGIVDPVLGEHRVLDFRHKSLWIFVFSLLFLLEDVDAGDLFLFLSPRKWMKCSLPKRSVEFCFILRCVKQSRYRELLYCVVAYGTKSWEREPSFLSTHPMAILSVDVSPLNSWWQGRCLVGATHDKILKVSSLPSHSEWSLQWPILSCS